MKIPEFEIRFRDILISCTGLQEEKSLMQELHPLEATDFKAKAKVPVNKLEIYIECCQYDLCNFFGENRLISAEYDDGQKEHTYNPIAAQFTAVIDNTDGLFHPENTDSPFNSFIKIGRRIIFYTGFKVDGVDHFWQRFEGVVADVDIDSQKRQITLMGFDYMQYLSDTKLKSPDNYWGSYEEIATEDDQSEYYLSAECNGPYLAYLDDVEIYNEKDWVYERENNVFVFLDKNVPGSNRIDQSQVKQNGWQWLLGGSGSEEELGQEFQVSENLNCSKVSLFLAKQGNPTDNITLRIETDNAGKPSGSLVDANATKTLEAADLASSKTWVDFEFPALIALTAETEYHLVLKRSGDRDESNFVKWHWNSSGEYELGETEYKSNGSWEQYSDYDFCFKVYKQQGTGTLKVYWFTDQVPENIVADLLVTAGRYPDRTSALAAMTYEATGVTLERVWFEAGTSRQDAIRDICERVDYQFYFEYEGTPVFIAADQDEDTWENAVFTFESNLLADIDYSQGSEEVKSNVMIEGQKYSDHDEAFEMREGGGMLDESTEARHIKEGIIDTSKLDFTPYVFDINDLDDIADGATYGKILASSLSAGLALLSEAAGDLDDIGDGANYGKVLTTDISEGHILLSETVGDLDDVDDGASYAKVLKTDISSGHILLSEVVGDLDDVDEGTTYGKVLVTDISSGHIVLSGCIGDLDDIADGSNYGRVAITDISLGHILLATCDGDLDDIDDGASYGKVASTSISAGKIIVAGLDSGVTARIFTDSDAKDDIENWRHASDVTLIDGGMIYTGSVKCNRLDVSSNENYNVAIGYNALDDWTTGHNNVGLGQAALTACTEGYYNVALGQYALAAVTTGYGNVGIGYNAGTDIVSGYWNTLVGTGSGANITGNYNVAIGATALHTCTSGNKNIAIGSRALYSLTTADRNIAIGNVALGSLTTARYNVAIGYQALYSNQTGDGNTALGYNTLNACTGAGHVAVGAGALADNTSADYNVGIGFDALALATTGGNNVAVGAYALDAVTTTGQNTAIGHGAGSITTGSGNVYIGYEAGGQHNGSNVLYIDNSNTTAPLIYGDFTANEVIINGALEVTGCITDGTCEIMTNEDALSIINHILCMGSSLYDDYQHERMDMKKIYSKYPFLIHKSKNSEGKTNYSDKLGAKSDLLYVAVMQLDKRLEALEQRI